MERAWLGMVAIALACNFDSSGLSNDLELTGSTGQATGESGEDGSTSGSSASSASAGVSGSTSGSASTSATTTNDSAAMTSTGQDSTTGAGVDPCSEQNGGCDPNATCDDSSGNVSCTCNLGYEGDGSQCSVDASLPTLRIEVPCVGSSGCNPAFCDAPSSDSALDSLTGDPSVLYEVTLHIRGVVEEKEYDGGMVDGYWNEGGDPTNDGWNVYAITIDDPPQEYFLNNGDPGVTYCQGLDYERTVEIRGGSSVRLWFQDANNCTTENRNDTNGAPIVIPGISPAPNAFNGQFLQLDTVDIIPVR